MKHAARCAAVVALCLEVCDGTVGRGAGTSRGSATTGSRGYGRQTIPGKRQSLRAASIHQRRQNPSGAAAAAQSTPAPRDYNVTAIPRVIAAGQKWTTLWSERGQYSDSLTFFVADGILAADDGGILIPQAEKSQVIALGADGRSKVVHRDTNTGGTLSRNKKGTLFIGQRELNPAIWQLAPSRRLLADRFDGDPLDCLGFGCLGFGLNDLTADSRGGVYFTMGGLYYADPHGTVKKYGDNLRTNGLVLSATESILYVTNGADLVEFDVQPDGSLINQRTLVTLPDGGGDGITIDSAGRIYVSGGPAGVRVVSPAGDYLGTIPTPFGAQSVTFGVATNERCSP